MYCNSYRVPTPTPIGMIPNLIKVTLATLTCRVSLVSAEAERPEAGR